MTGQRKNRVHVGRMVWLLALFVVATMMGHAQSPTHPPSFDPSQISQRFPDRTVTIEKQEVTQDMRRVRLLNSARQSAIVSDVDKLLALARQLNAGVTAEGAPLNALQRMKMASDIEKLAHNVKERMTYSATSETGPPNLMKSWQ